MSPMESRILMSQKQLNRYVVFEKSLEGIISVKEAAEKLGISKLVGLLFVFSCYLI